MKYDLKKIMTMAWGLKKEYDRKAKNSKWNRNDFSPLKEEEKALFSECLKIAWEEAKKNSTEENNKIEGKAFIKDWFLRKKCGEFADVFDAEIEILKETQKAVYGKIYCSVTGVPMEIWCPKSCLC